MLGGSPPGPPDLRCAIVTTVPMKLLLDILQGMGLSTATGLRPFLPAIAAGGLATADIGIDFDGTEFAFLVSPWWILALAAALILTVVFRRQVETPAGDAALGGLGIGLGALLCAASIDDRHDTWWYGLVIGAAIAYLASYVARQLFTRVRPRFQTAGDQAAAAALPFYGEAVGLVVALASVLFPPLSI